AGQTQGQGRPLYRRRRGRHAPAARRRRGQGCNGPFGARKAASAGRPGRRRARADQDSGGSGFGRLLAVGLHLPVGDVGLGGALLRRVFLHDAVAVLVALQALFRAQQFIVGARLLAGQLDRRLGRRLGLVPGGLAGVAGDLAGLGAFQFGLGVDVHAVVGGGLVHRDLVLGG